MKEFIEVRQLVAMVLRRWPILLVGVVLGSVLGYVLPACGTCLPGHSRPGGGPVHPEFGVNTDICRRAAGANPCRTPPPALYTGNG